MAELVEILEYIGGKARHNELARFSSVCSVDDARPDAVVFATSPRALEQALASSAGLILAAPALAATSDDLRIVSVGDARLAFAEVAHLLRPEAKGLVAATAVIDPAAEFGFGTSVGEGSVVAAGVRIGSGCTIGARVIIEPGVVLGDRVRVQAGAVLGSLGFGYARRSDGSYLLFPQQGTLVIEDDVEIGANTTIDRGALGETRIGRGSKIDNLVHIGHNCRVGKNVIIAAQTGISGSSLIEDGAILGGQVGLGEHATVGAGVILGGGAGVLSGKKLRGPGQVFWGRPARPLKQYLRDLARLSRGR